MLHTLLILASLVATPASALQYEADIAVERAPFAVLQTQGEAVATEDAKDDLTVYAKDNRTVPPVRADLARFTMEPTEKGWKAVFETAAPLPADPGMPVNFFVYADRDGDAANNATDGAFRAGADTAVLLLFGTSTKWHTQTWKFDPGTGKWQQQGEPVTFTAGAGSRYSMDIPASILPKDKKGSVRAFALTADNKGSIAIDVAPGEGVPPAIGAPAVQQSEPAQDALPVEPAATSGTPLLSSTQILFLATGAMLAAGAWAMGRRKMRGR